MDTEDSKEHCRAYLLAKGFTVEDIPTVPGEKRADLRAHYGQEEYILEAKEREETHRWRSLLAKVTENGQATMSRVVEPWNAVSSMIEGACRQLEATPSSQSAFHILWIVALRGDEEFVIRCVEKRLFGLETVTAVKSPHDPVRVFPCYYYSHADFPRFPILDAAVLCLRDKGFLCVNSFSLKREALRQGHLYSLLARQRAVRDPELLERRGKAFLIEKQIDRGPHGAQWQFLRDKYGCGTSKMINSQFDSLLSVPRDLVDGNS